MKKQLSDESSAGYDYSKLKSFGEDVFISNDIELRRPNLLEVGSHIRIDCGLYLTPPAEIGSYIHIGPYVTVIGGPKSILKIGSFITIGAGSKILCGSDNFSGDGLVSAPGIPFEYTSVNFTHVTLEDFSNLCVNSVVLPGVTIGEGSVIGACALVTKDTEPWTVYMGVPARPVKKRNKERFYV